MGKMKRNVSDNHGSMIIRGLSRKLRQEFHAVCVAHGTTMKDKLTELMAKAVKEAKQ